LVSGYVAAIGGSGTWSPTAFPSIARFFAALERGWTLAEAYFVASPVRRQNLYLIGDPLFRPKLPRSGFTVHGPVPRLEELNVAEPAAILRRAQSRLAIPESARLSNQAIGACVVRQSNELGRSELGCDAIRFVVHDEGSQVPPVLPIWPHHAGWRVQARASNLVMWIKWDRPLTMIRAAEVRLVSEMAGQFDVVGTWSTADRRDAICVEFAMPQANARYAWQLRTRAGVVAQTPWSDWFKPTPLSPRSITLLEAP